MLERDGNILLEDVLKKCTTINLLIIFLDLENEMISNASFCLTKKSEIFKDMHFTIMLRQGKTASFGVFA